MTIEAVVFDIGGVLELTPDLGWAGASELPIYALACERLAVDPARTAFVDDVPLNVVAAREAGLQAVLFAGNAATIAGLEELLAR